MTRSNAGETRRISKAIGLLVSALTSFMSSTTQPACASSSKARLRLSRGQPEPSVAGAQYGVVKTSSGTRPR